MSKKHTKHLNSYYYMQIFISNNARPQEKYNHTLAYTNLDTNVRSNIIHNSQEVETTKTPINS